MTVGHAAVGTVIPGGREVVIMPMAECERIFDGLAAPPGGSPAGVYRGRVVAAVGLSGIPRPVRRPVGSVLGRLRFPWYGKSFDGAVGANVWLTSTGRFRRYGYRVGRDRRSVLLDYDRPGNPRPLRPLTAEVRALAPGRYLCRAAYASTVLLYFTLEA